jgi:hypothetical protein
VPTYRYLLCDLLTDRPLAQLPLSGVSFGRRISRTGSLTGTLNCTTTQLIDMGRTLCAYAGRAALWVYRDQSLWWGGIPWTVVPRQGQRGAVQISLTGATFDSYAHRRRLYADKAYTQVDQGVIIPDLWRTIQADASGDIGVVAEDQPTGVLRDRTYLASELPYVGKLVEDLGNVIDGPEHTVDVYLQADGTRTKALRVANQFGTDGLGNLMSPRIVFQRQSRGGGTVLEWQQTVDAVDTGTVFQTRGDAPTGTTGTDSQQQSMSTMVERSDLLAAGWPRIDVTEDRTGVSEQATLDGYAQAMAETRGGAEVVRDYTVRIADTGWTPSRLGEQVRIKLSDDWHAGVDLTLRPVGVEVKAAERGADETVKLILGDE